MFLVTGISAVRESGRRAACENNAKQIALALHNYHDEHGCFPPAYVANKNGQPMHSWRTLLLPSIEENNLYNLYNFNEPWDGPQNIKLANTPITSFHCPSSNNTKNLNSRSDYIAVTGPGTIWPGNQGTRLEDITDGPSNTILLVELANSDIRWIEPRDITIERVLEKSSGENATVPTSNHFTNSSYFFKSLPVAGHIAMANGSIRQLQRHPSTKDLAAMLSINGGESISIDSLIKKYKHPLYKRLRWDHIIGLPLFLVTLAWLWIRMVEEPDKLKSDQAET